MDLRWNTIESAPRDGSWIVLNNPGWSHPFVGRWSDTKNIFRIDNGPISQPTMWCPLPHWEKQS